MHARKTLLDLPNPVLAGSIRNVKQYPEKCGPLKNGKDAKASGTLSSHINPEVIFVIATLATLVTQPSKCLSRSTACKSAGKAVSSGVHTHSHRKFKG